MPVGFPPNSGSSGFANLYNFNPSTNLTRWRRALANVKSGTANARLLCAGDSTTFGVGSNGTQNTGDLIQLSFPTQLAQLFNSAGINAHANSIMSNGADFGVSQFTVTHINNDNRVTWGSGWTTNGLNSLGGGMYCNTAGNAGAMSFLPTTNVDTFKVYYLANATSTATFTLDLNGSGTATINQQTGEPSVQVATITGTLGSNTLNIKWASGSTQLFIVGIEAYDSSKKWVDVINSGWSGSTAENWAFIDSFFWDVTKVLQNNIQPDLMILNLGINDWNGGNTGTPTQLASFQTAMQVIITAGLVHGDVIIMTPAPTEASTQTLAIQQKYINVMYSLAASNNIPLIDMWARFVSWEVSNPLGFYFNFAHPSGSGYADNAIQLRNILTNV